MPRLHVSFASFLFAFSISVVALPGCQSANKTSATTAQVSDAAAAPTAGSPRLSANQGLLKLQAGNERFIDGKMTNPHQDGSRRQALVAEQRPYAVILGCSDSRVPPELVFDAGLGDLFVVRVAGNVCSDSALASVEYATEHLGATLVVVLGHDKCGAVSAAIDANKSMTRPPGHLYAITHAITPAVKQASTQPGDLLDNAIDDNVKLIVDKLKNSEPVLTELVHSGKVRVVGARYHFETGQVTFYPVAQEEPAHD